MLSLFAELQGKMKNSVRELSGAGAPTNGTSGTGVGDAGPASVYFDYTNSQLYINTGTKASPTWTVLPNGAAASVTAAMLATNTLQVASGSISAANIIGTSAGQLGHAAGVIMVAAGGAHVINQLISCIVINDFSVAAYTAGGNLTVNIGGGGAALTGLISNANFIQAAADKIIEFVPLAAVPGVYTENNPLNLVSSAAPTNPGTAAGVFRYICMYRQIATGL